METVVLTIHLLLAFALIVVVLLQRSEGGGLGIGGGGGGVMSGRSAATALSKVTWMLGVGFVVTSLTLTVIAARQSGGSSVLDRLGVESGAPAAPGGAPDLGGDLLPPIGEPATPPATEGPAAPPAADAPTPPPTPD
jgi:preprotein translocase subunit SecG